MHNSGLAKNGSRVRKKNGVKGGTEGLGKIQGEEKCEREEKRREIKDSKVRGKNGVKGGGY